MSQRTRSKEIQALRALASVLVVIYHGHFIDGGYIGVDIFYVISGYLITGLILREIEVKNEFSFKNFYLRRLKRLLPASTLVVLVTSIASWTLLPATLRHDLARNILAASTYISNFLFASWDADYQNIGATPPLFLHYWSLAVEEQFYLLWPILIYLAYKWKKVTGVKIVVSVISILSLALSIYLTFSSPIWAFYIVPTRAWELGAGAALALGILKFQGTTSSSIAGFLFLIISAIYFQDQTPFPGFAALVPVIGTLLLISSSRWPRALQRVTDNRFTQHLGDISYSLYLWHWPVLILPVYLLGRGLGVVEVIVLIALTVLLADLTYKYVENPFRISRVSASTTAVIALTTTVSMVLIAVGVHVTHSDTFYVKGHGEYSISEAKSKPITAPQNCSLDYEEIISPRCEYGDTDSKKTVVLYGDSHADQWLPALDRIGLIEGFKVVALLKKACPAAEVVKKVKGHYNVELCQEFRDLSIARIQKIHPYAVIASGQQPLESPDPHLTSEEWWIQGEKKLFTRISSFTELPIYISDTPLPHLDIPDCLARGRTGQCDRSTPIPSKSFSGFLKINPTPWLCSSSCKAIVKGVIAYRDNSHISVAMSQALVPELSRALREKGLF